MTLHDESLVNDEHLFMEFPIALCEVIICFLHCLERRIERPILADALIELMLTLPVLQFHLVECLLELVSLLTHMFKLAE